MSLFTMHVNTNNDAFQPDPGPELARMLTTVRNSIEDGLNSGTLMDINGNTVGTWDVSTPGETHIVELRVVLEMEEMEGSPESSAEIALELVTEAVNEVDGDADINVTGCWRKV